MFFLLDPPSLDGNFPKDRAVVEGSNITLQCKVTAANPEPNITWYNMTANGTALSYGIYLTFAYISRSDTGHYYCVVKNGVGQAVTSKISVLHVQCK